MLILHLVVYSVVDRQAARGIVITYLMVDLVTKIGIVISMLP